MMPRLSTLQRVVLRNVGIAVGVALPVALMSGIAVSAFWPPPWAGHGESVWPSARDAGGAFLFWYLLLVLPTLAGAFVHQLVLAALPHDWSRGVTRAAIVASTLLGGVALAWLSMRNATDVYAWRIVGTLLPALLTYGLLARPLRPDRG
jgi:hypothetical protein